MYKIVFPPHLIVPTFQVGFMYISFPISHDCGDIPGGHCVRQAVSAQEPRTDPPFFGVGRHLSERRHLRVHVPRRGHAQVAHRRGAHSGADDKEEGRDVRKSGQRHLGTIQNKRKYMLAAIVIDDQWLL